MVFENWTFNQSAFVGIALSAFSTCDNEIKKRTLEILCKSIRTSSLTVWCKPFIIVKIEESFERVRFPLSFILRALKVKKKPTFFRLWIWWTKILKNTGTQGRDINYVAIRNAALHLLELEKSAKSRVLCLKILYNLPTTDVNLLKALFQKFALNICDHRTPIGPKHLRIYCKYALKLDDEVLDNWVHFRMIWCL